MSQNWERQPIAQSAVSMVLLPRTGSPAEIQVALKALAEEGKKLSADYELLLPITPDLASTYSTLTSEIPALHLIESENVSRGEGAAMQAAIKAAKHPLVFILPVGFAAEDFPQFLKEIDLVDIVCGARRGRLAGWKRRQFFSKAYQLFGLWLQDPDCPVRLYRRGLFDQLPIQSNGIFAHVEILAKANFQSKLLSETVIDGPVEEPQGKRGDFWRVLRDPDFGPPPSAAPAPELKPIISTAAPVFPQRDDD